MTLKTFVDDLDADPLSLVVANRTAPRPLAEMVEDAFEDQPVDVDERSLPDRDEDVVALVRDGAVVATSSLDALADALLLVNSDLFRTGARDLAEVDVPDVLAGLDEVPFTLRGYPQSDTEKLLLILVSRYVERTAWEAGEGTLRASFQRLSRIDDERGTRRVYETLADTAVDTHVYGVPDWTPTRDLGVTMHGGYGEDFRRAWFVVYVPQSDASGSAGEHAALVAVETDPGVWEGYWTYSAARVAELNEYIAHEL